MIDPDAGGAAIDVEISLAGSTVVIGGAKRVALCAWLCLDVSSTGTSWRRTPLTEDGLARVLADKLDDDRDVNTVLRRLREAIKGTPEQGARSGGLDQAIGPYARAGRIVFDHTLDVDVVRLSEELADGTIDAARARDLLALAERPWLGAVLRTNDVLIDGAELLHELRCCIAALLVTRWTSMLAVAQTDADALPRALLDELSRELPYWPPFDQGIAPDNLKLRIVDMLVGVAERVLAGARSSFAETSLESLAELLDRARQLRSPGGARSFNADDIARLARQVERLREFGARNLEQTVRAILQASIDEADADDSHIPQGRTRRDMLQPIWVRRATDIGNRAELRDGAFRWEPLESPWPRVTVRALPGYGKSWLLRHHASSLAYHALQRLGEDAPVGSLRVPVLLRCAQLGELLPPRPVLEDAITAISKLLMASHRIPDDVSDVLSEAHERERLVVCLDGLDEVPAADFERVRSAISSLTRGRNQVVVSTRPLTQALAGVLNAPGAVTFEP